MNKKRVITAAIGAPLLLLLLYLGGWWLGILLLLLFATGVYEYNRLIRAFHPEQPLVWLIIGVAYLLLGFLSFFGLRISYPYWWVALWLLLTVWSTDTAAYEIGRRYGRTPLAPSVSPHKTKEGALAGAAAAMLLAGTYFSVAFQKPYFPSLLITLIVSSMGQAGDLVESKVKRLAGVKDSGTLLPGHGGVLDRFDSILLAAPFAYILALILL